MLAVCAVLCAVHFAVTMAQRLNHSLSTHRGQPQPTGTGRARAPPPMQEYVVGTVTSGGEDGGEFNWDKKTAKSVGRRQIDKRTSHFCYFRQFALLTSWLVRRQPLPGQIKRV